MKKSVALFLLTVTLFGAVFADIISDMNSSMKSGNFKAIAANFSPSIELNLPGSDGLYSKAQAELLLRDFFAKNAPKNFVAKHDGVAQDGSKYSIGSLETATGNFRTYYYLKSSGGTFLIKELRIEKDK